MITCKKHDFRYDDNCLICQKEKQQKAGVILKSDEIAVNKEKLEYTKDCIRVVLCAITDNQHKEYLTIALNNLEVE